MRNISIKYASPTRTILRTERNISLSCRRFSLGPLWDLWVVGFSRMKNLKVSDFFFGTVKVIRTSFWVVTISHWIRIWNYSEKLKYTENVHVLTVIPLKKVPLGPGSSFHTFLYLLVCPKNIFQMFQDVLNGFVWFFFCQWDFVAYMWCAL